MKYSLSFRPEVSADASAGYAWYENKATGLGEEFLRLFYACSKEIPRNPFQYSTVHKDFRRHLLRRFPYAIYFHLENEKVIVFGLFHCARDPEYISQALEYRKV